MIAFLLRILHRENQVKYIRSLNESSLSFIVLGYFYFLVMKLKQFISEFRGYCMEFHNIRFSYVSWIGNYKKMDWGGNDLVRGEWNDTYHSYKLRRALWKPKTFWHLQEPDTRYWYLFTTMTDFLQQWLLLKYFVSKNLAWRSMPIPNSGVNTTVVNPVDIFCSWYKLKFGLLQGQVKSYHFPEKIMVKRQYFYFLYIFLGIIGWKRHWITLFGFIITFYMELD